MHQKISMSTIIFILHRGSFSRRNLSGAIAGCNILDLTLCDLSCIWEGRGGAP